MHHGITASQTHARTHSRTHELTHSHTLQAEACPTSQCARLIKPTWTHTKSAPAPLLPVLLSSHSQLQLARYSNILRRLPVHSITFKTFGSRRYKHCVLLEVARPSDRLIIRTGIRRAAASPAGVPAGTRNPADYSPGPTTRRPRPLH